MGSEKYQPQHNRWAKLKSLGLCQACGQQPANGRTRCEKCATKARDARRAKADVKRRNGICTKCFAQPVLPGMSFCAGCLETQRLYKRRLESSRVQAGLCGKCGKSPFVPHRVYCSLCILKATAKRTLGTSARWPELQAILDKQDNCCPYFGVPIEIGRDAELDHIVPRSKGGTNDPSNLQFIHAWANAWKLAASEEEFLRELDRLLPYIVAKRGLDPK